MLLPLISFFAWNQRLLAQTINQQIIHESWTFKDGAPDDVYALAQTVDGFLWLGTPSGLFRFDGTRFEPFHSPFGDELLSTNITALYATSVGGLWIGYQFGGFSFLDKGRLKNYGGDPSSTSRAVFAFAQEPTGVVWAATSTGLWRFAENAWKPAGAEWDSPNRVFYGVAFDRDGTLWAMGAKDDNDAPIYLPKGSKKFEIAHGSHISAAFTLNPDREVLTGSAKAVPGCESPVCPLQSPQYRTLDRTGSIWSIEELHVNRLPTSQQPYAGGLNVAPASREIDQRNTEPKYDVNPWPGAMLVDRENNVWIGGKTGLHRFFYSPLVKLELPSAIGEFALAPDEHGRIWVGSQNPYLYKVENGKATIFKKQEGEFACAYRAPDGTLWIGMAGVLWRMVGDRLVSVALPEPVMRGQVTVQAMTADSSGRLWVSFGRGGLYRLQTDEWIPFGGQDGIPTTGPISAFTDKLGRTWFGYANDRLVVMERDRVQVFESKDGLHVGNVTAIYGRGPEIWIGGEFGLQQMRGKQFQTITSLNQGWLHGISGIIETASGDLWLNGLSGIFHLARQEIATALENPSHQVKGEYYSRRKGLPGYAAQLRPLPTAIESSDGRLWFALTNGIVSVDPGQPHNSPQPSSVTILSVSDGKKSYQPGPPLSLSSPVSGIQFDFAAVSLSDPDTLRYRYKLQETDAEWHETSTAAPVTYRNLSPGSYHFEVSATDTNGSWSDSVARVDFTILPSFYQTKLFLLLCIATAGLMAWAAYMWRVRILKTRLDVQFRERLLERTRIARELHDTLLQSFQGVLLRFQAASNLLRRSPEEAKKTLDSAIEEGSQAIAEGRDAIQGLRSSTIETNDLAAALNTLAGELAANQGNPNCPAVEVQVEGVSRDLHPILRDDVFRITGEALRNAFLHAHASRIELDIRYGTERFRVRVRDDGKGIESQIVADRGRTGHWGLPGMHERAKLVGGNLEVWSQPDSGTEIELTIPASTAYAKPSIGHRSWLSWRTTTKKDDSRIS